MNTMIDTCAQAEGLMQLYLDGCLQAEVCATVEAHLATCRDCAGAYSLERALRVKVKHDCGCAANEDKCREELRAKLRACCHEKHDWA